MYLIISMRLLFCPVSDSWSDPTAMDMAAAALQANSSDILTFFDVLRAKLEPALGSALTVELQGGLFNKNKGRVKSMTIQTGDVTLTAENVRGHIECRRAHTVRGITLSSEELALPDWLKSLMTTLQAKADSSQAARLALESLLT